MIIISISTFCSESVLYIHVLFYYVHSSSGLFVMEQNHLCNFERGHNHNSEHLCENILDLG